MNRLIATLFVLLLCACNRQAQTVAVAPAPAEAALQGDYAGVLPCADCAGISTRISLTPDHRYQMQESYLGKSALVFNDHGRWSYSASLGHIDLISTRRTYTQCFRAVSPAEIRSLDRQGQELTDSAVNHSLKRAG